MWREKDQVWTEISSLFAAKFGVRDTKSLKAKYEGLKALVRKKSQTIKQHLRSTGGGGCATTTLTPSESKLKDAILLSVEGEPSHFDCDFEGETSEITSESTQMYMLSSEVAAGSSCTQERQEIHNDDNNKPTDNEGIADWDSWNPKSLKRPANPKLKNNFKAKRQSFKSNKDTEAAYSQLAEERLKFASEQHDMARREHEIRVKTLEIEQATAEIKLKIERAKLEKLLAELGTQNIEDL